MSDMEMKESVDTERKNEPAVSGPDKAKESLVSSVFDYLEILVFSVCAVLLIFTLCGRLCSVDGRSMKNTLQDKELLVTATLKTPEEGDIVVFHQTGTEPGALNKPLVKRVIATEGKTVRIDYKTGAVYVFDKDALTEGEDLSKYRIDEPYVALLDTNDRNLGYWRLAPGYNFDPITGIFEETVPEGCYFVMGDNRNNSTDSRSLKVGCVDGRRMLGVAVLRLKPFTVFK